MEPFLAQHEEELELTVPTAELLSRFQRWLIATASQAKLTVLNDTNGPFPKWFHIPSIAVGFYFLLMGLNQQT